MREWQAACISWCVDIYLHDRPALFQFVLRGELTGDPVRSVEHAWDTARSVLGRRELVVDLSGVTDADASGVALLTRMQESGARLTAVKPQKSAEFLGSLGIAIPRSKKQSEANWALRFLRLARLCG